MAGTGVGVGLGRNSVSGSGTNGTEAGPGAMPISASCSGASVVDDESVLRTSFNTLVSVFIIASQRILLCATSVFSVSLWWFSLSSSQPQRHREHRGCTEKSKLRLSFQSHAILFGHAGVPMALRGFYAALISLARFITLARSFVSAGQHAEGVAFIVGSFQVTIQ